MHNQLKNNNNKKSIEDIIKVWCDWSFISFMQGLNAKHVQKDSIKKGNQITHIYHHIEYVIGHFCHQKRKTKKKTKKVWSDSLNCKVK